MRIINVNFDLTAIAVVAVLSYFAYRHGYVYVRDKAYLRDPLVTMAIIGYKI